MVAVNGILSTNALANPDNQIIITKVDHGSPPVIPIAAEDSNLIIPASSATPMIMNNPIKKKRVGQSTSLSTFPGYALVMRSKTAAPPRAIIDSSKLIEPWIINNTTTPNRTIIDFLNKVLSFSKRRSSSFINCSRLCTCDFRLLSEKKSQQSHGGYE